MTPNSRASRRSSASSPPASERAVASTGESVTSGLDLSGRRAVITGANSGLGRECARVLALRGANVGMACRSQERATAVVEEFAGEMGRGVASRCDVLRCDLADMTSVRNLAGTLVAAGRPIDVLLLNAGVSNQPYSLTADGIEATFATNYLGHFLLLHLLADGGALAPGARIVIPLSSAVHLNPWARADLGMLSRPEEHAARFSPLRASPSTKVMLAQMALEFTRRVVGSPLAAAAFVGVCPGGVSTGNVNQMGAWARLSVLPLLGLLLRPVTEGVAPVLWAATAPELARAPGAVFNRRRQRVRLNRASADARAAKLLWDESERLLRLTPWP
jgi:NAD(P)-dependent dehydrogenase (short-subunit alcohol dehydrogenase family)